MSRIIEVCSCGAKLYYSSRIDIICHIVGRSWRKDHIHEPFRVEDELRSAKIQDDPNWHNKLIS